VVGSQPPKLSGRWLLLTRAAWLAVAAAVLGLNVAGIPYAYMLYRETSCTSAACADLGQLTPEGAQNLKEIGLSPGFYAAYVDAGLPTAVTLGFVVVAVVIFWRRSEDRMALFGAFMLVAFGGAAFDGTMRSLADAYPIFWLPAYLLDYMGQVSFVVFFYIFPDGRFVPRWTRWLVAPALVLYVPFVLRTNSPGVNIVDVLVFYGFLGSIAFAQIYRYVRVSDRTQRQQTKWVVFGFATALIGAGGAITLSTFVPTFRQPGSLGELVAETLTYGFICFCRCPLEWRSCARVSTT
jgi:hypothetical protein